MPAVSVIIPTYNRADRLDRALQSVLAQTYQDLEVIVVDDGSTDHTLAVERTYSGRVRYIYQENQGPAHARNTAIAVAGGKYIAFLDDDDVWLREKLQLQVDVLEANSTVDLVYAAGYVVREATREFDPSQRPSLSQTGMVRQLLMGNFFGICSVMVRATALRDTGPFDGEVVPCEDWDLWLRLAARGHRFAYVGFPVWEYRFHDGNAGSNIARLLRGRLGVVAKFFDDNGVNCGEIGLTRSYCLGRQYLRAGMDYYTQLQLDKAREVWWQALRLDARILSPALLFLIGKSCLGPGLLRRGREAKRGLLYASR